MRLSNKLLREMDITLRRFNAKVRRLERQAKEDIIIPSKVSKQELLDYENTNDIRRRLRSLQRFSRRGAEKPYQLESGEYVSVWEKKEHDILKRTAMRKLNRDIEYMKTHKPRVYGKTQDVTFAKTGDEAYLRLVSERNRLKTKGQLSKAKLEREMRISRRIVYSKNHQFRENYYKMLDDIGGMLGMRDKVDDIKDKLDELTDEQFVNFFTDDKGLNAVTFFYQTIEDGLFYANFDYIKENFNLMHEHLQEKSINEIQEMHNQDFGDEYDLYADENFEEAKEFNEQYKQYLKRGHSINVK